MIKLIGRIMVIALASMLMWPTESPAAGGTFKLTSPVGGEKWMLGTTHNITWKADGVNGQVLIEVIWRKKNGKTLAFASADGIPVKKGKWSWQIPYEFPVADTIFVQITLHAPGKTQARMQDYGGDFSIVDSAAPYIKIRSPAGGEAWALGAPHRISWETRNIDGTIKISLKKNGRTIMPIAVVSASARHVSWTPPRGVAIGSGYTLTALSTSAAVSSKSESFRLITRPPTPKEWTFLAYIGADNNLEEWELGDFLTMAKVGSDANVNIVAELDRHPAYDMRFGNWTDTKRYRITRGMKPTAQSAVQDIGEVNTGDNERLADFLCWAMDHYPAKRYMLVFSDHGYGWEPDGHERDEVASTDSAVIRDDTNGLTWVTTPGLEKALSSTPSPIAVVGFNACSMDMIEIAYQLRDTGSKVFIASQNEEDYCGWDYVKLFTTLQARPAEITEREIGVMVVDGFMKENRRGCPKWPATHAALDLSAMYSLGNSINALAVAILTNPDDKPGVRAAAAGVIAATEQAVIREGHSMYMNGYVFGTNIFFPAEKMDDRYTAKALDFVRDTKWKSFLDAYLKDDMASTWIGKARKNLFEEEGDGHVDIIAFCRGLVPDVGDIRVNVSARPTKYGYTIPQGSAILAAGDKLRLQALVQDGVKNAHFVRWNVKGDVTLANPLAATTNLTAHGNGSVTAVFAVDD